jgi:hypothetical protein
MSSDRHMEKGSKRKEKGKLSLSDKQYEYIDKKTRQEVYDALYSLEVVQNIGMNAKVPHIRSRLDEFRKEYNEQKETDGWNYYNSGTSGKTRDEMRREIEKEKRERTISERHIERILKTDPRIVKGEGNTYHIDKEARFETRYQRPDLFGQDMLHAAIDGLTTETVSRTGKKYKIPQEVIMSELIRRLGAFVVFNFIEAVRPFRDKCMNRRERNELVDYWKKNAFDIDGMFDIFVATLGTEWTARQEGDRDQTLAPDEVNESDINKMLETFKKSCPDIYENLMLARKQQVLSPDEVSRKENGEIGFVHGKTYLRKGTIETN